MILLDVDRAAACLGLPLGFLTEVSTGPAHNLRFEAIATVDKAWEGGMPYEARTPLYGLSRVPPPLLPSC
jgi:hypothetical protein